MRIFDFFGAVTANVTERASVSAFDTQLGIVQLNIVDAMIAGKWTTSSAGPDHSHSIDFQSRPPARDHVTEEQPSSIHRLQLIFYRVRPGTMEIVGAIHC